MKSPHEQNLEPMVRSIAFLSIAVAVLPMPFYPFLLLPNLMTWSAERPRGGPTFTTYVAEAFVLTSTAYPVVMLPAVVVTIVLLVMRRSVAAAIVGALPLFYLTLVAALMLLWSLLG